MKRKIPRTEEVLSAVTRVAGDGFCPVESLYYEFLGRTRRDVSTALSRTARDGYLLDRRGPDGRRYVGLSSEGWARLRSAPDPVRNAR